MADDYGYVKQIMETINRIERGDEQRGDREFLMEAMDRIPVSSSTHRRAAEVLRSLPTVEPNTQGSGTLEVPTWSPGLPTADFMMAFQGGGNEPPAPPPAPSRNPLYKTRNESTPIGAGVDPNVQEDNRLEDLYGAAESPGLYMPKMPVAKNAPPAGVDAEKFMPGGSLHQSFSGGGGPIANSLLAPGANSSPEANFEDLIPQGYSFSDNTWEGIGMLASDPRLMAKEMYGDNQVQATSRQKYIEAAMTLAQMGLIGGNGAADFTGGSASDATQLAAVEDLLATYDQPGMYVNPGKVYNDLYNRAQVQDFSGLTDGSGDPISIEDQVAMTNQALMAAAPFGNETSAAWLSSRLENAALQYRSMLANGEVTMSYPKYLDSIGARDWVK